MRTSTQALLGFFDGVPRPVQLHEPDLGGREMDYVRECIETGWVSSAGSYVDRFEQDLGEFCGGFAVPVVNGTAALHLSLILAGVSRDDEVLTPALTFVATANVVSYCGAIPHFVDCTESTLGVDAEKLDAYLATVLENGKNKHTGRKISALIVTHIFGHCADMDALCVLAQKYNLVLIEDAAESLGSYYKGKHTGLFGMISALSFNGNKILTTGGGGAVLTADKGLATRAKHLSTTAKIADPYMHCHDAVGYNYRMPNINAALGCAQLEKLPSYLEKKRRIAGRYQALLNDVTDMTFIPQPENTISNHWMNSVIFETEKARNDTIDTLAQNEIFCRGVWEIMTKLPMYKTCPAMKCEAAEKMSRLVLNLPSSPSLADYL